MYKLLPILQGLGACYAAQEWILAARVRTARALWAKCPRPDWMDWLVARAIEAGRRTNADPKDLKILVIALRKMSSAWHAATIAGRTFERVSIDLRAAISTDDLDALERVLVHYAQHERCLVKAPVVKRKG